MSVEVAGLVPEAFESGFDDGAFALVGDGRLRRLAVRLGEGWLTQRPIEEAVGAVAEHEAGALAHIRVSGGRRLRLEVTLESVSDASTPHRMRCCRPPPSTRLSSCAVNPVMRCSKSNRRGM